MHASRAAAKSVPRIPVASASFCPFCSSARPSSSVWSQSALPLSSTVASPVSSAPSARAWWSTKPCAAAMPARNPAHSPLETALSRVEVGQRAVGLRERADQRRRPEGVGLGRPHGGRHEGVGDARSLARDAVGLGVLADQPQVALDVQSVADQREVVADVARAAGDLLRLALQQIGRPPDELRTGRVREAELAEDRLDDAELVQELVDVGEGQLAGQQARDVREEAGDRDLAGPGAGEVRDLDGQRGAGAASALERDVTAVAHVDVAHGRARRCALAGDPQRRRLPQHQAVGAELHADGGAGHRQAADRPVAA